LSKIKLSNKKRLLILFYVAILLLVIILGKTVKISVFDAEYLQNEAEEQWTRELSVTPERGSILDRNGNVLAQSATVESVLLRPKNIESPDEVADLLAPILNMDRERIYDLASDTDKVEVWLKRQISSDQAAAIRELNLDGVDFFTDTKRFYPMNDFLSQVIGYTNIDGEGQEGIEKAFEKYLAGYPGTELVQTDVDGRVIDGSERMYIEPEEGLDVVLTVDYIIQSFTESAVREAYEVNSAKKVVAIVMDPNDASILAMVNYPEADLNNLDRSDIALLNALSRNTAVVDAYEPGSTFKIITTAAALDSGAVTMDTNFNCVGYEIVDGEKIKCWRSGNPHGHQTLTETVENSCNPAFMRMAEFMGTETFYKYIRNFGFGSKTGIDYSADSAGILRDEKYVKNVDLARIGFGQSVAVTPLQMCTAVSAVINGGTLYTPRLVASLNDKEGNIVEDRPAKVVRQVISEETSAEMRGILESVVANGSGKNGQIAGYRVGGKTGTAQVYEDGVIAEGKNISSFITFAPADDPKFLVMVVVYEPEVPVTYGSVVAAPYAKSILEKCLKYADIVPSDPEAIEAELTEVPDLTDLTPSEARKKAEEQGFTVAVNGEGVIKRQYPTAGMLVESGSLIELEGSIDNTLREVPDVTGLSLYKAYEKLTKAGYDMEVVNSVAGNAVVKSQSPAGGSTDAVDKVTVRVEQAE